MPNICLYLHAHQPLRLRDYSVFDIGTHRNYIDDKKNKFYLDRIADKSYRPLNKMFLDLIGRYGNDFKVSFSITGVLIEQLRQFAPDVLEDFQRLVATGNVELIGETYYHSLASEYSDTEFYEQVKLQEKEFMLTFGVAPITFRNTEFVYSNRLAQMLKGSRYQTILTEGADRVLGWRSPDFLYTPIGSDSKRLLLKNYRLSDDIAFRFSQRSWAGWPLTAGKFANWIDGISGNGETVNLFMDYETFGEHQWEDTGIFDFLKYLPEQIFAKHGRRFHLPSEAAQVLDSVGKYDVQEVITWADTERDLTAWNGNKLQQSALEQVYGLENAVKSRGDEALLQDWRNLQTSDHFYYMCTKWFNDGDVHAYFNCYETPYDAYLNYMNVIQDFARRLNVSVVSEELVYA